MHKISIYGASGHAKVVLDCIRSNSNFTLGYLFDDNPAVKELQGIALSTASQKKIEAYPLVITIGNNKIRKKIADQLQSVIAPPIIHQSAVISTTSRLGDGSVVMPGVILNADAQIGSHCILNSGAVIEHDCKLANYVHISPKAALAGNVRVGEGTQIGIGAQVIQGITIGKWCTIGAGAVIIKDVPDGATVVGNPGRIIK
ncbi:acetyltransferase [Mesonia aestuariivivens]|uniref:Acetyltransferase n=1 Tax=Mesonia aestuariivivens TaxID=2796128 RepID=A0ABS6W4U9_9FLAO|nr:acetyltransferase [Mesonia aestuariivivens]MBW2962898.1 acetyltransferase [Mesonia aestuariivivens]